MGKTKVSKILRVLVILLIIEYLKDFTISSNKQASISEPNKTKKNLLNSVSCLILTSRIANFGDRRFIARVLRWMRTDSEEGPHTLFAEKQIRSRKRESFRENETAVKQSSATETAQLS